MLGIRREKLYSRTDFRRSSCVVVFGHGVCLWESARSGIVDCIIAWSINKV